METVYSPFFEAASLAVKHTILHPAWCPNHTSHKKVIKKPAFQRALVMAPPHGFEPRYQQPECRVLPLDEGGTII